MTQQTEQSSQRAAPVRLTYRYDPDLGGFWVSSAGGRMEFIPNRTPQERRLFPVYVRLRLQEEAARLERRPDGRTGSP
jgi:hypothetical protein